MVADISERERLEKALAWLRSHHRRLQLERKSVTAQLEELTSEIERIGGEIDEAGRRLSALSTD